MERECECGQSPDNPFGDLGYIGELGCIECGERCCPACGVCLESALYCARCAGGLMGVEIIA